MAPTGLTLPPHPDRFAVVLFGLECQTTAIVLRELLSAGIDVRLLCLPGKRSVPVLRTVKRQVLPMSGGAPRPPTAAELASASGIELWRLGSLRSAEVADALSEVRADLIIVACYGELLPSTLYANRRHGGINLHPSLLPDKRGPDPLFWVFRDGDEVVGSTVHRLTDQFDAGDILAQQSIAKPDGITEDELDAMLARLGAQLVIQVVSRMITNGPEPLPQDESKASWAPHPKPEDFILERTWSAHDAYNFVRGVQGRGHPILVDIDGVQMRVDMVHGWFGDSEQPEKIPDDARAVAFADGTLILSFVDDAIR